MGSSPSKSTKKFAGFLKFLIFFFKYSLIRTTSDSSWFSQWLLTYSKLTSREKDCRNKLSKKYSLISLCFILCSRSIFKLSRHFCQLKKYRRYSIRVRHAGSDEISKCDTLKWFTDFAMAKCRTFVNCFLDHDFFFNFISGIAFENEFHQVISAYGINENLVIIGKPLGVGTTKKLLPKLTNWMQDIFSFSF